MNYLDYNERPSTIISPFHLLKGISLRLVLNVVKKNSLSKYLTYMGKSDAEIPLITGDLLCVVLKEPGIFKMTLKTDLNT